MWKRLRPKMRSLAFLLGMTILITAVIFGRKGVAYWQAHTLNGSMEQLLAEPRDKRNLTTPMIRGKAVIVDKNERRVSDLYFELPEELRATSLAEVGTVVWLDWSEKPHEKTGTVTHLCTLTLIDHDENAIVGDAIFSRTGQGDPAMTNKTILDYLIRLRRVGRKK